MTFAVRAIDLTFKLGTGDFGASGQNTVTLRGLRVEAEIEAVAGTGTAGSATTAILRIYGMTLSMINQLTVAGLQWTARQNQVLVQAGDNVSGMNTVFSGQIVDAYPDFSGMPEVSFVVTARPGLVEDLKPVPPVSYPGPVDVAEVMKTLAANAGLTFENNGVSVMLPASYFPGTTGAQIRRAARAAGISAYIDGANSTLAIWPKGGSRGGSAALVSPATGMIGYPEFRRVACTVRTLYSPTVLIGGRIRIDSQLTPANGTWFVSSMTHNLVSQTIDGPWETVIHAVSPQAPQ